MAYILDFAVVYYALRFSLGTRNFIRLNYSDFNSYSRYVHYRSLNLFAQCVQLRYAVGIEFVCDFHFYGDRVQIPAGAIRSPDTPV